MHKTLLRQLQRAFGDNPELSAECQDLLQMVSTTYEDFDKDRILSERSLEISSKELRLAIAIMRTTLDSVGEAILVIDENQKIAYFNKRFVEVWEIPKEHITPHQTDEVIAAMIEKSDDPKSFRQIIDSVNGGHEIDTDTNIKLIKQNVIAIKSSPQLLEGKNVGRIWIFRDITKYTKFKEEIQEKVTTLEQLNRTMVDRELKMIELKEKLTALEQKLDKGE